jgi:hypothetical protein
MVLRNGRSYRTDAQKRGGGKTRREQLGDKLRRKRRRLREKGLKEIRFHVTPTKKARRDRDELAVYGINKNASGEWVLLGMAATDQVEKINHRKGGGYSDTEVRERRVVTHEHPRNGMPIKTFDTKNAALNYVSADGSEKVEAGAYVVRPDHNPRARIEEVDKDAYQRFRETSSRVYE